MTNKMSAVEKILNKIPRRDITDIFTAHKKINETKLSLRELILAGKIKNNEGIGFTKDFVRGYNQAKEDDAKLFE